MRMFVLDPDTRKRLLRKRRLTGADRFDEVWNGVYVMSPLADITHQRIATRLASAIDQAIGDPARGTVFAGVNVSDRDMDWKKNYRCPDVAVFLAGNPAQDRGSHWLGGPDFAAEVISPYDRTRLKAPFYAGVGVRELLLVDRKPWSLELYRLRDASLELVGRSDLANPALISSAVLPASFRLVPGAPEPRIEVVRDDGTQTWLI